MPENVAIPATSLVENLVKPAIVRFPQTFTLTAMAAQRSLARIATETGV
jgi:hypothetical protein